MPKLTERQIQFLKTEFGLTDSSLENITPEEWEDIRLQAFDIEAELYPEDDNEEPSERCALAVSIVDTDF